MMLTEETTLPQAALPLAAFRAHLHLGSGFAEAGLQDEVLEGFLRAAMAAIEARTGKVLIAREFMLELPGWAGASVQPLPLAPVVEVAGVTVLDRAGGVREVDPARWRLERDMQRPCLCANGGLLPGVPTGGRVVVRFRAGMAADWAGLPADLAQAVLLLAAHYYEYRQDTGLSGGCMPFGVTSLIERYRALRVSAVSTASGGGL